MRDERRIVTDQPVFVFHRVSPRTYNLFSQPLKKLNATRFIRRRYDRWARHLLPSSRGQVSHFILDDNSSSTGSSSELSRAHTQMIGAPIYPPSVGLMSASWGWTRSERFERIGGVQALTLPAVIKCCPSIKPTSLRWSRLSRQETSSEEPQIHSCCVCVCMGSLYIKDNDACISSCVKEVLWAQMETSLMILSQPRFLNASQGQTQRHWR